MSKQADGDMGANDSMGKGSETEAQRWRRSFKRGGPSLGEMIGDPPASHPASVSVTEIRGTARQAAREEIAAVLSHALSALGDVTVSGDGKVTFGGVGDDLDGEDARLDADAAEVQRGFTLRNPGPRGAGKSFPHSVPQQWPKKIPCTRTGHVPGCVVTTADGTHSHFDPVRKRQAELRRAAAEEAAVIQGELPARSSDDVIPGFARGGVVKSGAGYPGGPGTPVMTYDCSEPNHPSGCRRQPDGSHMMLLPTDDMASGACGIRAGHRAHAWVQHGGQQRVCDGITVTGVAGPEQHYCGITADHVQHSYRRWSPERKRAEAASCPGKAP